MSQTIKTFLKYSVALVVFMLSVVFITTTVLAMNEVNVNPGSGSENGNEGGTPASGSEIGNEGGNVAIIPGDGNPGGNGPTGGSTGSRTTGSRTIIQISDIKVSLVGFSIPTTNLARGSTYTISWNASIRNANTSISLVSSAGAIIVIGTSANPSINNTVNWTVPAYLALGTYTLRFTDSSNRITDAPSAYKIVSRSSGTGAEALGIGGGSLSLGGRGGSGTGSVAGTTEILPGLLQIPDESSLENQTATVGNAFTNFWGNKYVLWFFILLLIIAGTLLIQERRNRDLNKPIFNKNK